MCEFDWGEVKLNIGEEGFKKYQMAVFTAAKSNYRFAMLFKSQDTPAFQQSHADFFERCQGSFRSMVYDNMKVAVRKFVGPMKKNQQKPLWNSLYITDSIFDFATLLLAMRKDM
ncbi:hypothetical protein [Clostridium autoethanogenum]|uniref:Transposase n=1 Tax=Clostridium autoethanogenum DSM 10061 TaxID=1341692 RepID=A0ABY4TSR4_9CLOT|nr:hypothetical protein [Clostridium autoethanogenum]URS74443.1 hypothetical protein CAETHG_04975 [Clostridium autoethanogenum DSM 10061]